MLEMSWITAIFQLYSQVADLLGNVIIFVKRINIRIFDLLARFHYILNLPRMSALSMSGHLLSNATSTNLKKSNGEQRDLS